MNYYYWCVDSGLSQCIISPITQLYKFVLSSWAWWQTNGSSHRSLQSCYHGCTCTFKLDWHLQILEFDVKTTPKSVSSSETWSMFYFPLVVTRETCSHIMRNDFWRVHEETVIFCLLVSFSDKDQNICLARSGLWCQAIWHSKQKVNQCSD